MDRFVEYYGVLYYIVIQAHEFVDEIHFYIYYVLYTHNRSHGSRNTQGVREVLKIDLLCTKEYYEYV